jgi:hypothetical protein
MDEQDEEWLKEYNISKIKKLEELDFERIFALIERETQAKVKKLSLNPLSEWFLFRVWSNEFESKVSSTRTFE